MPNIRALIVSLALVLSLAALAVATAQQPASPSPSAGLRAFVGTWKLVGFESSDPDSRTYRGEHPFGLLVYDAAGNMAVQIAPDRVRRPFTGPVTELFSGPRPTPDEAFDAIAGYASYFGTYVVDERAQTVTHQRVANVNPGGLGDFVRRYEFETPDRLVLVPLERSDRRAIKLTWERQK
jgi:hypothetical protein